MTRDRTHQDRQQDQSNWPANASADSGSTGPTRDYRQESEASDDQLNQSLDSLAQMFAPRDIVNRGAQ